MKEQRYSSAFRFIKPHNFPAQPLLHHVHKTYPNQDTKIENVPEKDRHWPAFRQMGYLEVFRRIEMVLELA